MVKMKKILILATAIFFLAPVDIVHAKPLDLRCDNLRGVIASMTSNPARASRIDYIIWRESRCNTMAFNPDDPMGGSYGLFQINSFWCKPTRYFKGGWLQQRNILDTCEELFNPIISAKAFSEIFSNSGWHPWGGKPTWN